MSVVTGSSWTCPFCGHVQTITAGKTRSGAISLNVGSNLYPALAGWLKAVACSNPDCQEVEIVGSLGRLSASSVGVTPKFREPFEHFHVRPNGRSRVLPAYVPTGIKSDYAEACKIASLSPKASATLARRCIQGMIRDYCGISRSRLIDEINALRKLADEDSLPKGVTLESIDAIDAIRKIGNIGAHMESDVSVIVDVDEDEASALVQLIEILIEDWYVARATREARFAKAMQIAADKTSAKKPKL